jgi:hypothetical protein
LDLPKNKIRMKEELNLHHILTQGQENRRCCGGRKKWKFLDVSMYEQFRKISTIVIRGGIGISSGLEGIYIPGAGGKGLRLVQVEICMDVVKLLEAWNMHMCVPSAFD